MFVIDPSLSEEDQKYALLSYQAGVAVTSADITIRSVTKATEANSNGDWQDTIVLDYVPTSNVLKNTTDVDSVETSYTCVDFAKVLAAKGYEGTVNIYEVNGQTVNNWHSQKGTYAAKRISEALGITVTAANIKNYVESNWTPAVNVTCSMDVVHFAFRGSITISVGVDNRIEFGSKFATEALDGFAATSSASTLEGTGDMLVPETATEE